MQKKEEKFDQAVESMVRLVANLKPKTSTQLKSTIAALYLAQNNQPFRYANIVGLLQLDMDRKLKTKFLRMYDLESLKLAFEVELYYDFHKNYKPVDKSFYSFDYEVGTIGLLFKAQKDAQKMYEKIKVQSPTKEEYDQVKKEQMEREKKEKQSNSFFGKIKRKFLGEEEEIIEQGKVLNAEKKFMTLIDEQGRMVLNGEEPTQKDLQDKLKLSPEDFADPEIMSMIASGLVIHNIKKEVQADPQKNKELISLLKQHQKQQNEYIQDCRKSRITNLPPPPPPPPLLAPTNTRVSLSKRANLMEQIRNNNLKLKHVTTNQKGGLNIDLSDMDAQERNDFAAEIRRKIAMRKKALNKWNDSDDDD